MVTVARILGTDELQRERCVACGAPGEVYVDLETPEGVPEPRGQNVPGTRLCGPCAQGQADASKIGARLVYGIIALAPAVGLVTGLVTGRRDGIAVTVAVVVGLVVARSLLGRVKQARARGTRVLLLEAEGDRVVLQLLVPDRAASAAVPGYRAAASEDAGVDEHVTPLPPRTSFGLPWYGGLLLCVPVVAAAWNGAFTRDTTLVIDSPSDAVRVSIDDTTTELAPGGRATLTVRAGEHSYAVQYVAAGRTVRGSFDVSTGMSTLLSTDPSQCYRVWTTSAKSSPNVHENGTVRWANLLDVRMATRSECGRGP
jgi:hypothetical protein